MSAITKTITGTLAYGRNDSSLQQLFDKAREYGLVHLYTCETGCYHISIKFNTIKYTKLEAMSSFKCKTIREALFEALEKAEEIRKQFK